jgi:hypothetical protein
MSAMYCEICTKLLNTLLRQNIFFYIKLDGIYSYHCASLNHFLTECVYHIVKFSEYAENSYLSK